MTYNPEPTTDGTDEPTVEARQTVSGHVLLNEENTTDGRWLESDLSVVPEDWR